MQSITACTQSTPRRVIIDAGRFIDGTGADARSNVRITIHDGTIVDIQHNAPNANSAEGIPAGSIRQMQPIEQQMQKRHPQSAPPAQHIQQTQPTQTPQQPPAADRSPRSSAPQTTPQAPQTPQPDDPDDNALYIDATRFTVMPGLIDAHAHLLGSGACTPAVDVGLGAILANLHALVNAGFTTVADLSAPLPIARALREYVGTGRHRGPRVLTAGPMLVPPNGYLTAVADGELVRLGAVHVVESGPDSIRKAVQGLAAAEMDFIKVAIQAEDYNHEPLTMFDRATLCTLVQEAHALELRVIAHALTPETYTLALDCGVDALAHGSTLPLDEALTARIVATQIPIVPTHFVFEAFLWGPHHLDTYRALRRTGRIEEEVWQDLQSYAAAYLEGEETKNTGDVGTMSRGGSMGSIGGSDSGSAGGDNATLPPVFMKGIRRSDLRRAVSNLRANTTLLHDNGVQLGFGTDAANCFSILGHAHHEELQRFVQAGLSATDALRAATYGAARVLNLQDAVGTLQVGYRADILIVEGKPDKSLDSLRNVRHVLIDGVPQTLGEPGWGEYVRLAVAIVWEKLGMGD